jgi:hypothetical protein
MVKLYFIFWIFAIKLKNQRVKARTRFFHIGAVTEGGKADIALTGRPEARAEQRLQSADVALCPV